MTKVTFLWSPSDAGPQWLDLSLTDNGFAPGTFVSVGPLPPTAWAFDWDGLRPGATHYVRVNTLSQGVWQASGTLAFTAGTCGSPATTGAVQQSCAPTAALPNATFNWSPSLPPGSALGLDLSLSDNGFAPGTFVSVGPLPPSASSLAWPGLRPGLRHYWRLNTLTASGWVSSATTSFETAYCGLRLLFAYSPGCSHCANQTPIVAEFERRHPEVEVIRVRYAELNSEQRGLISGTVGHPVMVFYDDEDVRQVVGETLLHALEEAYRLFKEQVTRPGPSKETEISRSQGQRPGT